MYKRQLDKYEEDTSITTRMASFTWTITAGNKYKVCYRVRANEEWSDWSDYSTNYEPVPETPAGFVTCQAKDNDPPTIALTWNSAAGATSYDIRYATDQSYFEGSDQVTEKTGLEGTQYTISSGLETGVCYYFQILSLIHI